MLVITMFLLYMVGQEQLRFKRLLTSSATNVGTIVGCVSRMCRVKCLSDVNFESQYLQSKVFLSCLRMSSFSAFAHKLYFKCVAKSLIDNLGI